MAVGAETNLFHQVLAANDDGIFFLRGAKRRSGIDRGGQTCRAGCESEPDGANGAEGFAGFLFQG